MIKKHQQTEFNIRHSGIEPVVKITWDYKKRKFRLSTSDAILRLVFKRIMKDGVVVRTAGPDRDGHHTDKSIVVKLFTPSNIAYLDEGLNKWGYYLVGNA